MQVAEVDFAGNIKMITMKKLILLLLFIPLVSLGQKIYSVDYSSRSDVKVYVVDYESQADKKIFFVDYASRSDLKVFFVKYKSRAGWRNTSKKHLIY